MLKTDLLPVLNAEATHLGVKPVDDRKWRDWIEEDLIEEPKPQVGNVVKIHCGNIRQERPKER